MAYLNLRNPDMTYRPVPFWSWNDKLEPEELRRQIREMHSAGIGGFFMHARGGLQTAYLSDEWMDCVKACCDEAGKLGMGAWLYDENGWPSGFGGGIVNGLGEAYQQKYLRFEVLPSEKARCAERSIAFYSEDGAAFLGRTLPEGVTGSVMRAYYDINRYYVDNLDPRVVAEFIRVTHERYYASLPSELLRHMKGIFTDEPQLSRNGLVWSLVLEDAYRSEYGRELLPVLPALAFPLPGCAAVRTSFWRLCAKQFRDSFMKPIHDWCESHGWKLTGHHVLEETCHWQITSNGAIMPQYQYYSIPGVDHLGRLVPRNTMMTQIASAAAQFGQKRILTESFACTGWNCNFSGQRYIFQPELAHGINWLCQHLEGYTLRGLRKRDYPSSASYHQPWWGDYRVINDYFSRVGSIMAEGRTKVDTLVVHPLSTVWTLFTGNPLDKMLPYYTDQLMALTTELDSRQVPHHYCDELIYEEHGRLTDGGIVIGECRYSEVVIPPVTNLSGKLCQALRTFHAGGGFVCRIDNTHQPESPLTLDGLPADAETLGWFTGLPAFGDAAAAAEAIARRHRELVALSMNGAPATGMLSTWRDVDNLEGRGGRVFYLVNASFHGGSMVHVSLPKVGSQLEIIEPLTGAFRKISDVTEQDGRYEFDMYFGGADAMLFFQPASRLAVAPAVLFRNRMTSPALKRLDSAMVLSEISDNLLTLDRCRYRVDGGAWAESPIISLQSKLVVLRRDCDVELEIPFQVGGDFDLETPLTLVVETPSIFRLSLNGVPFESEDRGFLFDSAFRKVQLPKALRTGRNVLSLALRYHQKQELYDKLEAARKFETEYNTLTFETELESVYLLGPFTVRHVGDVEQLERDAVRYNGQFELAPSAAGSVIDGGDFLKGGFPFFAGKAVLQARATLTATEADACKALRFRASGANGWKVTVNGTPAGACYWEPYIVSVDGLLKEGVNTIEFEMTTSLRNMLGPHHLAEGEAYGVGTISFNIEDDFVGHKALPNVKGYCFVKHGLSEIELC